MNLTKVQNEAFEYMLEGHNVFLTGPGGSGKTYLLNYFIDYIKKIINLNDYKYNDKNKNKNNKLAITSTTGISAMLINGVTLHSWAGVELGDKLVDYYHEKIKNDKNKLQNWLNTKILIIDEVSMLNPELFQRLDILGRKLRQCDKPFGGIQLIVSGDFCQLPTVDTEDYCFEAFNWGEVIDKTFYLKENLRADGDKIFQDCLNEIRMGIVTDKTKDLLNSRKKSTIEINGIIPTVLYSRKKKVEEYNEQKLTGLLNKGIEYREYRAEYKYNKSMSDDYKSFLKTNIDKNQNIKSYLKLCVGCQVIVNVSIPHEHLVNGSRGVVTAFIGSSPVVKFKNGKEKKIELYKWELEMGNKVFKIQIPLMLGWALTIHKAQGMTLDHVYTDVGSSIFEYGQSYVVLSRVRSLDSLFLKDVDYTKIYAHPKVIRYYNNL